MPFFPSPPCPGSCSMTFFYPGHFSGLGENLDQGEHQGDLKSWPEDNPSFAGTDLARLISLNSFQTLLLLSPLPPPPHPRPFCSSWSKTLSLSWLEFLGFNEAISKLNSCILPKKLKFIQSSNEMCGITLHSPCSLPGMYLCNYLPPLISQNSFRCIETLGQ